MAQKLTDDKKGNSTGFGRVDVTPPPYWIMTLLPHAPPGSEATLMPNPGPGQVPAAHTAPPAALPEMGDRRATVSAGPNPSDGNLWSMPPEFHLSWTS